MLKRCAPSARGRQTYESGDLILPLDLICRAFVDPKSNTHSGKSQTYLQIHVFDNTALT